nr:putative phage tail protein [uncultured Mediterranean phage uvMED]BAR23748.1 putative phage tail protein [uncultured Mediterranean phage uvMED]BAR23799.1 putative phage tail protein [uncultured Mediterranean phage uvMED]
MSLHQSAFEGGRMVPYRRSVEQPLLPYEKRLITALGCSEQEYRQFAQEVERRYKERPEEYAHIPDIRNADGGVTLAIISLVVSVLSTAAAMLLTPKPKQPGGDQIRRRQLGGRSGKDIYAPSFGFESLQELAEYGQTVPIAFTRREGAIDSTDQDSDKGTGGLLISPELVWSRMKSWGVYQVAELVTIAGQGNMARPELAGIFLGNNALDGVYEDYFDFYWNGGFETQGSGSRIRAYNLRYGNLAIDGDRDNPGLSGADQVFYAPTSDALSQPAFCGAFTPSSQTRFGVFTGVPNGTPFRPNWKIISIVKGQEDKTDRQLKNQQKKYVDPYLMDTHPFGGNSKDDDSGSSNCGMPGTGTNYARRIGIVEHIRGGTVTRVNYAVRPDERSDHPSWQNLKQEVDCEVGDQIKVLIGKGRQKERPFSASGIDDVDLSDIQSAIQAESARYDALFSRGSTWMVGRTTWRVTHRSTDEPYDGSDGDHVKDGIVITLKCIECWSRTQKKIGIVAEEAIKIEEYLPFTQEGDDIHEAWYPLLKYELGTFQNTRACDVTEIGVKSQVWSKFEGITNFNTVPSPGKLVESNKDKIQLAEGKVTSFAHRMSLFALDVRPSNYDSSIGSNNGWVNIGPYLFAVVGNSPVDVYSFIRIQHPERKQFEYRLRPFNSAVFVEQSNGEGDVFVLDGARFGADGWKGETVYGDFFIGARGYKAQPRDYFTHREMAAVPELITDQDGRINIRYNSPQKDTSVFNLEKVSITATETGFGYKDGDEIERNTLSNILSLALGVDPYFANDGAGLDVGDKATIENWDYTRESGREVFMKLHLIAYEQNYAHTVRNKWWRIESVELVSFNGEYSDGETFDKYARNANGVQFAFKYKFLHPTNSAGAVEFATTATRLWQKYSGLAEVSHYSDLISRSCDNNAEHEVVYVNESLAEEEIPQYEGCALAGLKLKSSDNFNQLDQLRCYMKNGIEVERLIDGDTASSNLLTDLLWYLITNKDTGAGSILNADLVDKDLLRTTGRYLRANKLYWDDVVAESINLRTWLASQAASVLCFVSLRNGKMAIEPALPYDGNHKINDSEAVTISAMFTEGNIIEDSLEITWLELEERKMFQAAIIYQQSRVNQFPEQKTLIAYYGTDNSDLPIEEFSFKHITSDEHAAKVARYFLSLRKHLTHTITFKTLPWGLSLEAGKFIRVASELSPYRPDNNGIIQPDGTIVAVSALADGAYNVYYWERQTTAVSEGVLHVKNGKATELFNVVFSLKESAGSSSEIYQIEALDIDEDGIVTIKASNYAVDENGISQLAKDVLDTAGAITIEGPLDD